MDRSVGAVDLFAVEQYCISNSGNARINFQKPALDRKMKRLPLNLHFSAAHRVATDDARVLRDMSAA